MEKSDQQYLKDQTIIDLEQREIDFLIKSALLIGNSNYTYTKLKKKPKSALINILIKNIDFNIISSHKNYINSLSLEKSLAFSYFKGIGYVRMANFMTTKTLSINLKDQESTKLDNLVSISENTLENKEKEIARRTSEFKKIITKHIENSEKEKQKIIKSIHQLKLVIRDAPLAHSKDILLYRGEYNSPDSTSFSINTKDKIEKNRLTHDIKMINLKIGDKVKVKKFSSFSFAPWVARGFNLNRNCCLYRTILKKESKLNYLIAPPQDVYNEFEIILPPHTFKLINITTIYSPLSNSIYIKIYDIEIIN